MTLLQFKPCKKCGVVDRYLNGDCRPCADKRSAIYNELNKEKIRAAKAQFRLENKEKLKKQKADSYKRNAASAKIRGAKQYAKNKDHINAINKKWAAANPEKIRRHKEKWAQAHPENSRIRVHNYRSRKRAVGGKLSSGLAEKLFKLQKGKCPCCKQPLGDDYHMDHVMPLALGGSNSDENMQLLRAVCNLQKNAKHPIDFMQSRGNLL